jgi:carbon-monoxide dehydrogenase large subunit
MTVSGSALLAASDTLIELGRSIASGMLEAASSDLEYAEGEYRIAGTDRSVTLQQVAARASEDGNDRGLAANGYFTPQDSTNPNGCHIAEVEVDPDTGVVSLLRYSIAQDIGRVLNPAVVKGQLAGGVAQGIGQALLEKAVFDPDSGQLLSGSFADYTLPRADDLPAFEIRLIEVPCLHTPLGMKSCGEIGATGGPAATFNAVMDALAQIGVTELTTPATPQAVFKAVQNVRDAGAKPAA